MFSFYKFNIKKVSSVRFFLDYFPILSFLSPISSVVLILFFLKNISMLDVFMGIDISVSILVSIFTVFMIFIVSILLPFYGVDDLFYKTGQHQGKLFYISFSFTRSVIILLLLSLLFLVFNVDGGSVTRACFVVSIFYLIISSFLNDGQKIVILSLVKNSIYSYLLFLSMFFLMIVVLSDDDEIFKFVLWYLFFLSIFDCISIIEKRKSIYLKFIPVLFLFLIFLFIDGFKFQKAILKVFGGVQDSSQNGWYLVKDRNILDFFTARGYLVKDSKNIDDRKNYYINGYLLFNIGNLKVICPHNFEITDNKKLDFSRCLSLTSEDIKFMGRDFPKNNKNIAVMVAKQ